jgi:hypothetical protein
MATSALLFNKDLEAFERREKTDDLHQKKIEKVFDTVVNEIKEAGDWKVVSFGDLLKRKVSKSPTDRGPLMQRLQDDDNIIAKPAQKNHAGNDEISITIPLAFKYVEKKEKDALKSDGICYRKIQGELKETITRALEKIKLSARLSSIFSVTEQLIICGAKDGWVKLPPLYLAAKSYVHINDIFKVLDDLQKAKLLACGRKEINGRTAIVCRIALTEENYGEYLRQVQEEPESISLYTPPKKTRNRHHTKLAGVADPTREKNIRKEDKELLDFVDNLLEEEGAKEKTQVPKNLNNESHSEEGYKEALLNLDKVFENQLIAVKFQAEQEIAKKRELLERAMAENRALRDRLDALENKLERTIHKEKQVREFHVHYAQNTKDTLGALAGDLTVLMNNFIILPRRNMNDPQNIKKFKRDVFNLIREANEEISNYKIEKYAPALIM